MFGCLTDSTSCHQGEWKHLQGEKMFSLPLSMGDDSKRKEFAFAENLPRGKEFASQGVSLPLTPVAYNRGQP